MDFYEYQEESRNNALILFSKLEKIFKKNKEIKSYFNQIRKYSRLKKRSCQINFIDFFQFKSFLLKQQSSSIYPIQNKFINFNSTKASKILKIKIQRDIEFIYQSQCQQQKTRQQLRNIIQLSKQERQIKQDVKEKTIIPKPFQERLYEICLAIVFFSYLFTISYTIIYELKN